MRNFKLTCGVLGLKAKKKKKKNAYLKKWYNIKFRFHIRNSKCTNYLAN